MVEWFEKVWYKVVDFIREGPRGLVISIGMSLFLLLIVGNYYGLMNPHEEKKLQEQIQIEKDRELIGPPGPMSAEDRFRYDAWRQETTDKFLQDEEPFVKPRLGDR